MIQKPSKHRKARPTQADVARYAGVSQSTVSHVLNGTTSVSIPLPTRRRVESAVRELGYLPNRAAQSLRTMKTYTIACVIPDITNPFYPALERAVQSIVDARGYDLLIYNTEGLAEKEHKCLRLWQQGRIDGLVGVFFHVNARNLRDLIGAGVAVVRIETHQQERGVWPLDNLYIDNFAAAYEVTRYLLKQGHRRITLIAGPSGPRRTRVEGYEQAMIEAEAKLDVVYSEAFTTEAGTEAMMRVLARIPRPTAVFAANDMLAIGAMKVVQQHNLKVPSDVAIMGFDDIPAAELVRPSLSTVRQFQHQLGARAAEMLFDRLEGRVSGPARCEEQSFELVIREST